MGINRRIIPTAIGLELFFFEGMLATGWASDTPAISPHPALEGWEQTLYETPFTGGHFDDPPNRHKLRLTDSWGDGEGLTVISLSLDTGSEIMLWMMKYTHNIIFHPKHIPHLRESLRKAYAQKIFQGGRGITEDAPSADGIQYKNNPRRGYGCNFEKFYGYEQLVENTENGPRILGDTEYWGGLVLGLR